MRSYKDQQRLSSLIVLSIAVMITLAMCSGCTTAVPVIAKFPNVPPELLEKCPRLKTIDGETTTFSNLTETVNANYAQYYICANKSDSWVEWYNTQKKIYESVK